MIVFVSIILLLIGILGTHAIMSETKDSFGDKGVSSQITRGGESKDWTIMVFMNADNNLHKDGLKNINSMEVVGPTPMM